MIAKRQQKKFDFEWRMKRLAIVIQTINCIKQVFNPTVLQINPAYPQRKLIKSSQIAYCFLSSIFCGIKEKKHLYLWLMFDYQISTFAYLMWSYLLIDLLPNYLFAWSIHYCSANLLSFFIYMVPSLSHDLCWTFVLRKIQTFCGSQTFCVHRSFGYLNTSGIIRNPRKFAVRR